VKPAPLLATTDTTRLGYPTPKLFQNCGVTNEQEYGGQDDWRILKMTVQQMDSIGCQRPRWSPASRRGSGWCHVQLVIDGVEIALREEFIEEDVSVD